MKKVDSFQEILNCVRNAGTINSLNEIDLHGVFSSEIDGEVNSTNFLKVKRVGNGAAFDASCILKVEFLPTDKPLQIWAYEIALDMLFGFHGLGYTRVSNIKHYQEHALYRFLQLRESNNKLTAIYGITVGSGRSYIERNMNMKYPKLEEDPIYGELASFYDNTKIDPVFRNSGERRERDLSSIIYKSDR